MKKRTAAMLWLSVLLISSFAASGVRLVGGQAKWPANQPPDPWADVKGPRYGGVLRFGSNQEPVHLNPAISASGVLMWIGSKFYEPLVTYGSEEAKKAGWGDDAWYPMLAKSWKASEDKLTWTLNLYENATWHDGKPITTDDVLYSWGVFKQFHPTAVRMQEIIKSMEAPDKKTIVIKMNYVDAAWQTLLPYLSIIPKHIFDIPGVKVLDNEATRRPFISSGPFKFVEWKPGEYIRSVRNDNYYKKGLPYLNEVYYVFAADALTVHNQFEVGEVDFEAYGLGGPEAYVRWQKSPTAGKVPLLAPGTKFGVTSTMLMTDPKYSKYTSNKLFRQALAYATDHERIVRDQTFNLGIRQYIDFPQSGPNSWVYNPNIKKYNYDPAKANELLDSLGYKWDAEKKWRLDPDTGKTVTLRFVGGTPPSPMTLIQRDNYEAVGIKIDLILLTAAAANTRVYTDFDFDLNTWSRFTGPFVTHPEEYLSAKYIKKGAVFSNGGRYNNSEVTALFTQARQTFDPEQQKRYLWRIQEILADEVPNIVVYGMGRESAYSQAFKGLYWPPIIDMHHDPVEQVWWVYGELRAPPAPPPPPPEPPKELVDKVKVLEDTVKTLTGQLTTLSKQITDQTAKIEGLSKQIEAAPAGPTSLAYGAIAIAVLSIVVSIYLGRRRK